MPEGDTLFRTARTLGLALAGRVLTGFRSAVPAVGEAALVGRSVDGVEARGKNLLIHFDDGHVLYTHLRMNGSWHIYRTGEPWRKPERQARVVLETSTHAAICFNAPVVELLCKDDLERHPILSRLGPDLLAPDFDLGEARARLRQRDHLTIGEALLVQSAVAGIGNVYKSETLFLCRQSPQASVRELSDDCLDGILRKARELMSRNLEGYPRTTRRSLHGSGLWVYGKSGRRCRRCGRSIRMERQGLAGRSTYWCPKCQPRRPPSAE